MFDFSTPLSALNAHDVIVHASANNIANVNTDGYKRYSVHLESDSLDRGVQVASVYRDMTPGPAVIYNLNELDVRDALDMSARGMRNSQENYDTAQAQDVTRMQQEDTAAAWYVREIRAGQDAATRHSTSIREGSNTDLPREFANLMISEWAYGANAVVARTMDELTGSIVNIKV